MAFGASKALEEILAGQMIKAQLAQQQQQEQARLALDQQRLSETTRRNDLNDKRTANIDRRANADDLASVLDSQFDPESSIDTEVSGEQQAELAGTPHAARVREIPTISARPVTPELEGSIDQTPQVGVRRMTPTGEQRAERRTVDLQRRTPPPEDPIVDYENRKKIDLKYREPTAPSKPSYEWVIRDDQPTQIQVGTAQPGDTPYDSVRARSESGADAGPSTYAVEHSKGVIRKVTDLLGDPADPKSKSRITGMTAGVVGSALSRMPFQTDARDVSAELHSLAANLAFEQLQKMREASKTGGALGNVSNAEIELLQNAVASIRQDQSVENLTRQLGIIRESAQRFLDEAAKYGDLEPMAPVSSREQGGGKTGYEAYLERQKKGGR